MSKAPTVQIFSYKIVIQLIDKYLFSTYYVPGTNFHAVIRGKQDCIFTFKKITAGPQIM